MFLDVANCITNSFKSMFCSMSLLSSMSFGDVNIRSGATFLGLGGSNIVLNEFVIQFATSRSIDVCCFCDHKLKMWGEKALFY